MTQVSLWDKRCSGHFLFFLPLEWARGTLGPFFLLLSLLFYGINIDLVTPLFFSRLHSHHLDIQSRLYWGFRCLSLILPFNCAAKDPETFFFFWFSMISFVALWDLCAQKGRTKQICLISFFSGFFFFNSRVLFRLLCWPNGLLSAFFTHSRAFRSEVLFFLYFLCVSIWRLR